MKCISAVTIGKLIEAHMEHDEKKFMAYANFIADAYEESGEDQSAMIIRKKISGEYKKDSKVTLDEYENYKSFILQMLLMAGTQLSKRTYPYTVHDGKRYRGTIHVTEGIGFHDGQGHKIEFR